MSISTRKGDSGHTDLLFGQRVAKHHPRIAALGDVDELNAALGLLRVHAATPEAEDVARTCQEHLIGLMGELATPVGGEARYQETHPQQLKAEHVAWLDGWVEKLEREGAFVFRGWVLPGAARHAGGAQADFARTVCRRAERAILALDATGDALPNADVVRFLNRLSDVLWLLARWEEKFGVPAAG
jgi:cob(I)alamin adenosyltransferase